MPSVACGLPRTGRTVRLLPASMSAFEVRCGLMTRGTRIACFRRAPLVFAWVARRLAQREVSHLATWSGLEVHPARGVQMGCRMDLFPTAFNSSDGPAVRLKVCGVLLAASMLAACSPGGANNGANTDGTHGQPDAGSAPPCTFLTPATHTVAAGGRLELMLETSPAAQGFSVDAAPSGWTATQTQGQLVVRAPYQSPAPAVLHVDAICNGEQLGLDLTLSVRPLRWEAVPAWQPGVNGPVGREYGAIWMDAGTPGRVWIHGGFHYRPQQFTVSWDTWSLDLETATWTEATPGSEPPHLAGGRVAPVLGQAAVLLHSGLDANSDVPPVVARFDYAATPPSWQTLNITGTPMPGDYTGAFVYDPRLDRYLQVCGVNNSAGYHCQVWELSLLGSTGGQWRRLMPAGPAPAGRNGFFFALDEPRNRLVLFSGEMGGNTNANIAQDTWALELDPLRWVKLADAQDPPLGRRNGAYVFDPEGHRLFVWGGTADGATSFAGLYALHLDEGEDAWFEVPTDNPPPPRASGMAAYDAAGRQLVMGFGNSNAIYEDMWLLHL